MTHKVKIEGYIELETQTPMTDSEVSKLIQTHVTNCLTDNPDADGSTITFADITVVS